MLAYAGTAEDAKMFLKYTVNRASSAGALDNIRMVIETALVDGLLGSTQVLKTLPQKRAFLQALHPKDCLRLLNTVGALLCRQNLDKLCSFSFQRIRGAQLDSDLGRFRCLHK